MRYENKNLYIRKRELDEIQKIKNMKIDNNISYEIYKKNLFNIEGIQKYLNLINYKYPILELNNIINENKINISVQTTKEAICIMKNINLFKYICKEDTKDKMKLNIPMNYNYKMILESSQEAKIILESKENKDIYVSEYKSSYRKFLEVYTSKECFYKICFNKESEEYYIAIYDSKESEKYIKYNFIDFYAVLANISKKQAIVKLINLLGIEVINVKELIKSYNENLNLLNSFSYTDIDSFILFNLVEKYLYVLKEIIKIALVECYFYNENKNIGEIYFSISFLANKLNKSISVISSIVNGFCLLGFINKRILNENINKVDIVYTINSFDTELLKNAIEIAKKMRESKPKIKFSGINKKNIKNVFGEEIANSIFLA